jgi:uncharacterized protein (UPF0335 family)
MNNSIREKLKQKEKLEKEIKKIYADFERSFLDNISIGYAFEGDKCFISIHKSKKYKGFREYFPREKLDELIEHLQQLKKSIDFL